MAKKTKPVVDIKTQMIEEKDSILKELIGKVEKMVALLIKQNPYKTLSDVLSYFKSSSIGIATEHDASREYMEAKFALEFVQMLLSTIERSEFGNDVLEETEFFELINNSSDIFGLKSSYLMSINSENKEGFPTEYVRYIFSDFFRADITGKRYEIFEVIHHEELLTPLSYYFKNCYGFEITAVFDGIAELKNEFTFGLSKTNVNFARFMEDKDPETLTEEEQEQVQEVFSKFLGLELHNVNQITKWTEEFIGIFGNDLGDNKSFSDEINFESITQLHFDINKKPLIKLDGNYYCPQIQRLLDNFSKILIKDMCKRLPEEAEQIRHILADTSEKIAGEMFQTILPNANVHCNNYYKLGSNFIENDIFIEYNGNLLVVEVKSGSFTPDLAFINMTSHIDALNKLIEKADTQSNRFIDSLKANGSLKIHEDDKKGSPVKKTIYSDNYDNIFKIVITLDGFNELEARIEKLGFLKLNDGVIVISIDDLRVYADYFKNSPAVFLHYLEQRALATKCKGIDLNDELDHLGLYIEYNTYTSTAEQVLKEYDAATNLVWDGYREDIDMYYNQLYLKQKEVEKPTQVIMARMQEIISFCEDNSIPKYTQLTTPLLNLEPNGQREEFELAIDMLIKFFENNKRPKYGHYKGIKNMFISCIYDDLDYDVTSLYNDAYANMKISCIDDMTLAFFYYDKERKLQHIKMDILELKNNPFPEDELEKAANLIKNKRLVNAKEHKKIGRNELCPCGSGKKYKKCCLK